MIRVITVFGFLVAATAARGDLVASRPVQDTAAVDQRLRHLLAADVDAVFAQWNRLDSPGCSVAISQSGVVAYEQAYGAANVELGTPLTPKSVFFVASVSKQFTAMSILLLVQHGKLALDDEVRKHVPELPDYGRRLTIRHLLTHTSGLRDVFLLRELAAPRDDGQLLNDAFERILVRQRALNFDPGSAYQYNNGGYVLLANIVSRVSGQSLRAFADANIFAPLAMKQTHFHDDPRMLVPDRASGYSPGSHGIRAAPTGTIAASIGNSGLFTTARDLLRWEHNFEDPRVGTPALIAAMQTPAVLTDGETTSYGFGLQIREYRGLRTIGHGGDDPGYRADVVRFPDQQLAVAVLCNRDDVDAVSLARRVGDIYLADVFTRPAAIGRPAVRAASISGEQLADKSGLYRDRASEALLRITASDGKIFANAGGGTSGAIELSPMSPSRFAVPGTDLTLEFPPHLPGRPQELHVLREGKQPEVLSREKDVKPSRTELLALAGDYVSSELGVTYTLHVDASGVQMRIPGRQEIALHPIFADAFHPSGLVDSVRFTRDAQGSITGFTVHAGGVRSLRFDRRR